MRKQDERNQERESLIKGLKDKLEWYTMCAADEEYDEKAVESILYLLDSLEPLEAVEEPEPEEAWGSFQAIVREREMRKLSEKAEVPGKLEMVDAAEALVKLEPAEVTEVLMKLEPVEMSEVFKTEELPERLEGVDTSEEMVMPALEDMSEMARKLGGAEVFKTKELSEHLKGVDASGEMAIPEVEDISGTAGKITRSGTVKSRKRTKVVGMLENGKETEVSEELGISARLARGKIPVQAAAASTSRVLHGLAKNQKGAVRYNKYIVAAVLVLLVVSVFGIISNVQAGASPDTGFFHWLKHDNTGIQMITSPENLDGKTDVQGVHTYSNSEDVPEWAQEWLKIDDEFEMSESYGWSRYEIEEGRNFHKIASVYMDTVVNKEILLGMVMYYGEISFNTEELANYNYVDSYEIEHKEMRILRKTDEMGINYYLIYFFESNCQYFMQGQDNLEELKSLIKQYWLYVKNNLEENEIICNKLLSQAIYK